MSKYDSFSNRYELGSTMEGGRGIYLNAETMRVILQPSEDGMHSVEDVHHLLEAEREIWESRIAQLEEANADLLAAAEVRSEELGKARNYIRELAERVLNGEPAINEQMAYVAAHIYYDFKERAQALVAQWEAESEAVE